MQWEGKWGPASIIGTIGIVITIGSIMIGVETITRLTRLETKLDLLMSTAYGKRVGLFGASPATP